MLTFPPAVVADGCLVCSDDNPYHCHRRIVVEYFEQHSGGLDNAHPDEVLQPVGMTMQLVYLVKWWLFV